jgi:hypothetical protein
MQKPPRQQVSNPAFGILIDGSDRSLRCQAGQNKRTSRQGAKLAKGTQKKVAARIRAEGSAFRDGESAVGTWGLSVSF